MPVHPAHIPEEWDFYYCRVDDTPASILLNMWFAGNQPVSDASTFYWAHITMLDPGEHGLGSAVESDALGRLEATIASTLRRRGFYFVGRVRNRGAWQLAFFGPNGRDTDLATVLRTSVGVTGRAFELGSQPDPGWNYYHEFLFPDEERRQWMLDRCIVDGLAADGDALTQRRRVDHWIYFSDRAQCGAFLSEARSRGFVLETGAGSEAALESSESESESERDADAAGNFSVQLHRVDSVELDDIHAVVMELIELAHQHDGDYEGWGTELCKPE